MKCSICQKDLSLTKFIWKNVLINGICYTFVCDECAKIYLNVFLEENDPQFSRESCSHIIEYDKAKELLIEIKNKPKT